MAVDTASAGEITVVNDAAKRAILSAGSTSSAAVYEMVIAELTGRQLRAGTLVDVGCGTGRFFSMVRSMCSRYIGVDIVRYESFPAEAEFHAVNLDGPRRLTS